LKLGPILVAFALLLVMPRAWAHIGSPDVYAEGSAGPYRLFVVIRPPSVIPGLAEISARVSTPGVQRITIVPLALTGEASRHAPAPDAMKANSAAPLYFAGQLWIMSAGSWQIRFTVEGKEGRGAWSVPLPAAALETRKMQPTLGVLLSALGVLLLVGLTGILGAAAREAQLVPGEKPSLLRCRSARISMAVSFTILVAAVVLGDVWWKAEAADYARGVYMPLLMHATLEPGNQLDLKVRDPGWMEQRKLDDFIPDHGHLMHLYMVRWPQMDVLFHLHPQPVATGEFCLALPTVPAGDYRIYADVVHADGFPETLVANARLPAIAGRVLTEDDAEGQAAPVEQTAATNATRFSFPDGYTMIWNKPPILVARAPEDFSFMLLDPSGRPAKDTELYMGMLGHAAFVKDDGAVFAHIHPSGTIAMAALMLAQTALPPVPGPDSMEAMYMKEMPAERLPSSVSFPYGFPTPGRYRIFVQMKHGGVVETGVFDATVAP
jgi:hypothetical protein